MLGLDHSSYPQDDALTRAGKPAPVCPFPQGPHAEHPECLFGGGSLGCVAVDCGNPHHRAALVGQRAPGAAWSAYVALTGYAGERAHPAEATPAPAYQLAPRIRAERAPRRYTRRTRPQAPAPATVDLFSGVA